MAPVLRFAQVSLGAVLLATTVCVAPACTHGPSESPLNASAQLPSAAPVVLKIDGDSMFSDLETLASPQLAGRYSKNPEIIAKAAEFIANTHRKAGTAPIGPDYLVDFDLVTGSVPADTFILWVERDGKATRVEDKLIVATSFGPAATVVGKVAYVGFGVPKAVPAKTLVLVTAHAGGQAQVDANELLRRLQALQKSGAVGALIVAPKGAPLAPPDAVTDALQGLSLPTLWLTHDTARQWFTVGGKDLDALARDSKRRAPKHALSTDTGVVSLARPSKDITRPVPNVAAVLQGGELAHEIVVLGAHYDHIGTREQGLMCRDPNKEKDDDSICNGADDNASGTAMVLELARAMTRAGYQPKRTIVFAHFAGEELGLLGSKAFANNPPAAPPFTTGKVVAMLNMDMVGRLGDKGLEIGGVNTSPAWRALLQTVVPPTLQTVYNPTVSGRSDHAHYHRRGIPVLFFFTGLHDDYHRTTDESDRINRDGLDEIGALVLGLAQRLGDGADIPAASQVSLRASKHR